MTPRRRAPGTGGRKIDTTASAALGVVFSHAPHGEKSSVVPRRLRVGSATIALLVTVACIVAFELLAHTPWRFAEVRGAGWRAVRTDGATLTALRDAVGVELKPGESIEFDFEEDGDHALTNLAFTVERLRDYSHIGLRTRATDNGAYELRLGPNTAIGVSLGAIASDRPRRELFDDRKSAWVPASPTRFRFDWRTTNDRVGLTIDSKPVFDFADLRPRVGAISLTARGAPLRIHEISLLGRAGDVEVSISDSLDSLPRVGFARHAFIAIMKFGIVILAIAIALSAAYGRRFKVVQLVDALGTGAIPVATWFVVSLVHHFPPGTVEYCGSLVVVVVIAAIRLRGAGSALAATPGRIFVGFASMLVGAAIGGLAVERELELHRALDEEIRYAEAQPEPVPFRAPGFFILDLANTMQATGQFRDLDLEMNATLEPSSLLELRVHANRSNAVALFLSSHPDHETRFVRESESEFTTLGMVSTAISPAAAHRLRIEVRGEDYRAFVDGELVAEASERRFPAGETTLLAAHGRARIDDLSMVAVAGVRSGSRIWTDVLRALVSSVVLAAAYSLIAGLLLRRPVGMVFVAAACSMIPAFLAMFDAGTAGAPRDSAIATTITFFVLATIQSAIAIPGTTAARFQSTIFLALGVSVLLHRQLDRRFGAPTFEEINQLSVLQFDGRRIEPAILDLEHPLLRRWNFYLRDHEFRDRRFEQAKRPGQLRVIGLGTSSTYGYGGNADWPTLLEHELKDPKHGFGDIDVINAGCSGSTGSRLIYFLTNTLIHFDPDVLVLSLFHNDSVVLTQFDEPAALREITSVDGMNIVEHLRFRWSMTNGMKRPSALNLAWNAGEFDPARDWNVPGIASPTERFESILREYVRVTHEHGIRLVFLQEPLAGDMRFLWKDEFRAVVRKVAAEIGAPVVDPTAAQLANGGAKLFVDHIHPNAAGHRVTAKELAPVVAEVLRESR